MRASSALLVLGLALVDRAAWAQSHVTCVGDSITRGDGTSDPATKSYPAVLQGLLGAGSKVENDGHSGATMLKSGDVPYWTTGEYGSSTAWATSGGDVVIELGTNDSKPRNWANKASFLGDCEALVDHYRSASPSARVWISLIPPATASACCTIDAAVIDNEVLPLLKQCAADKGATTIDVHAALAAHTDWLVDGVHPNDAGAALVAQTVYAALSKLPTIDLTASPPTTPAPAAVTLTASPVAAYGKVEKVRFFDGAVLAQETTSPPWSITLPRVAAGSHVYTAEIVETAGRTRTSAPVTVVVAAPPDDGALGAAPSPGTSDPSSPSSSSSSGAPATEREQAPAPAGSEDQGCTSSRRAGSLGMVAVVALVLAGVAGARRRQERRDRGGRR